MCIKQTPVLFIKQTLSSALDGRVFNHQINYKKIKKINQHTDHT